MAETGDCLRGKWGWGLLTQDAASGSHPSRLAAAESEEGLWFQQVLLSCLCTGDLMGRLFLGLS